MTEAEYLDDLLGQPGNPDYHIRWVGDKPNIDHITITRDGRFDDTDNDPSDPEQNWEEELNV